MFYLKWLFILELFFFTPFLFAENKIQSIIVDESHFLALRIDGKHPLTYQIKQTSFFILDYSQYVFILTSNQIKNPNPDHILITIDHNLYRMNIPNHNNKKVTLSTESLSIIKGHKLKHFKAGTNIYIELCQTLQEKESLPLWSAIIHVKK